jgi:hypothetical protein
MAKQDAESVCVRARSGDGPAERRAVAHRVVARPQRLQQRPDGCELGVALCITWR